MDGLENSDPNLNSRWYSFEVSTQSSRTATATMDPRVWGALPKDLLEKFVAHLDPMLDSTVFQCRAVSKAWKCLTSSSYLMRMQAEVWRHVGESYQLFQTLHPVGKLAECGLRITMYDFGTKRWLNLPTGYPALPLPLSWDHHLEVVATCGGLLCILDAGSHLWMCNPVRKTWRRLPPVISQEALQSYMIQVVVMDSKKTTYRVVLLGLEEQMVYDSSTGAWTTTHDVLPFRRGSFTTASSCQTLESIAIGNFVYMLVEDSYSRSPGLIIFDVQQGCLVEDYLKIPGDAHYWGAAGVRLLTYKGSLIVLVYEIEEATLPKIKWPIPVVLRRYEPAMNEFTLIAKMPDPMATLMRAYLQMFERACVAVHGDVLFITTHRDDCIMKYNFLKGSWESGWIERSANDGPELSEDTFRFEPTLSEV